MEDMDFNENEWELKLKQENAFLRARLEHHTEHVNAKFELVDNTNGAEWGEGGGLVVDHLTVRAERNGHSIRSMLGFSTLPMAGYSGSLIHAVNYFEVTINKKYRYIYVGLAEENFPMVQCIGTVEGSFGIGINVDSGAFWREGTAIENFAPGNSKKNDVVGCGVMITQKTENGEAVNCEHCEKQQRTIFFTKNGKLLGTPIPLPSNVPSKLYPAVSLYSGCHLTANFGTEPFKYAIPPADGLKVCVCCGKSA